MSKATHTPGPWRVPSKRPGLVGSEEFQTLTTCTVHNAGVVAHCGQAIDGSPRANARLIAAAPDLLAALEWLTNLGHGVGKAGRDPLPGEIEAALEAGKAALAKAKP